MGIGITYVITLQIGKPSVEMIDFSEDQLGCGKAGFRSKHVSTKAGA